jgi:hypothetical protein
MMHDLHQPLACWSRYDRREQMVRRLRKESRISKLEFRILGEAPMRDSSFELLNSFSYPNATASTCVIERDRAGTENRKLKTVNR